MRMEGILWKWTNYFSGWQPRWFVLENGILSYYKSQEDVTNGCKGSLKIAVCDVMVHQTDISRMDLIIPGEQHFYLRASTPQERQQWLVSLGSAKACLNYGKIKPSFDEIPSDEVRQKKSELRLYCDLLMQQVHSVREAVRDPVNKDLQKLDEATSLLRATCDTFISTLDECMTMVNAGPGDHHDHPADPSLPASPVRGLLVTNAKPTPVQRATSVDRSNPASGTKPRNLRNLHQAADIPIPRMKSLSESDSRQEEIDLSAVERSVRSLTNRPRGRHHSDTHPRKYQTFFSNMSTRFCDVIPINGTNIPTLPFIDACRNITPLFDRMGPTAFTPLKADISTNIARIHDRYVSDPVRFKTLQDIVQYDIDHSLQNYPYSVSKGVLWLKRAVDFTVEFLKEFRLSEDDLTEGVVGAYTRTLRPYHGWVLRGMFAVALRAIPDKPSFVRYLALNEADALYPDFVQQLHADIDQCLTAQEQLCRMLTDYLIAKGLDSDVQV